MSNVVPIGDCPTSGETSRGEEFTWVDEDRRSIVVPEQLAIAVYENPAGNVVIRQQGSYPDEDVFIIVVPFNIRALVTAPEGLEPK